MHGGFAGRPLTTECRIDCGVDALLERSFRCLLGFPHVDVAQGALGLPDAQVQQLSGQRVKQDSGGRSYHSPRRAELAAATRRAVRDSARELFIINGYTATTVAEIAISGTAQEVPAEQRD
jgi:hypothetical protein